MELGCLLISHEARGRSRTARQGWGSPQRCPPLQASGTREGALGLPCTTQSSGSVGSEKPRAPGRGAVSGCAGRAGVLPGPGLSRAQSGCWRSRGLEEGARGPSGAAPLLLWAHLAPQAKPPSKHTGSAWGVDWWHPPTGGAQEREKEVCSLSKVSQGLGHQEE